VNPFETETMADLCIRQGHVRDARAILQRLLARANDESTRRRLAARLTTLDGGRFAGGAPTAPASPTAVASRNTPRREPELPVPGVRAIEAKGGVTVEWRLPPETASPAVAVLLLTRGPGGIASESRVIPVGELSGRLKVAVADLHSARVAVGFSAGDRFVPLARA